MPFGEHVYEYVEHGGTAESALQLGVDGLRPPIMSTPVEQLAGYAMAFERTFADDDWGRLVPHLAPDVEHEMIGGGPLAWHTIGRDETIADQKRNVEDMDRRFDVRIPEVLAGPEERDGAVWTGGSRSGALASPTW